MKTILITLATLFALSAFVPAASAAPSPLVWVCVDDVNAPSCYHYAWVCVEVSRMVPQCVERPPIDCAGSCSPCTRISCEGLGAAPIEPLPVGVCVRENGCWGYHDACVSAFSWVPQCVDSPCDSPYFDCNDQLPIGTSEPSLPEPQCMDVYWEQDIGPVRIVSRDSCHVDVYLLA